MRLTIGWLWMLGTGVVVVNCGGQTTLTVEQPQPSDGSVGAGGATNVTGGAAGATGGSSDLDGSTPINTDAADASAALMCVGDPVYVAPTLCIDGEVCVHTCGGASCRRIPAGCVIGSQACGLQICYGTWLNDREIECITPCIY